MTRDRLLARSVFGEDDAHAAFIEADVDLLKSTVRNVGAALRRHLDRDRPAKSLTARREASRHQARKNYITITPDMREELRDEFTRTNAKPSGIFRARPTDLQGLTEVKISHWRTGRVKRAHPEEWAYVLAFLKALPDKS